MSAKTSTSPDEDELLSYDKLLLPLIPYKAESVKLELGLTTPVKKPDPTEK